jgi:hypothetical protein
LAASLTFAEDFKTMDGKEYKDVTGDAGRHRKLSTRQRTIHDIDNRRSDSGSVRYDVAHKVFSLSGNAHHSLKSPSRSCVSITLPESSQDANNRLCVPMKS